MAGLYLFSRAENWGWNWRCRTTCGVTLIFTVVFNCTYNGALVMCKAPMPRVTWNRMAQSLEKMP